MASLPPDQTLNWHGGQTGAAARAYPSAPAPWLDLSTGISPWAYPVGRIGRDIWERLPSVEGLCALEQAAAASFGLRNIDQIAAVPGSEFEIKADLVLLAMGFVGPQRPGLLEQLDVGLNERGNVERDGDYRTNRDNVFVCGDMGRGQSLIVWAISDGREAARDIDGALTAATSRLPCRGADLPFTVPG